MLEANCNNVARNITHGLNKNKKISPQVAKNRCVTKRVKNAVAAAISVPRINFNRSTNLHTDI